MQYSQGDIPHEGALVFELERFPYRDELAKRLSEITRVLLFGVTEGVIIYLEAHFQ